MIYEVSKKKKKRKGKEKLTGKPQPNMQHNLLLSKATTTRTPNKVAFA